MNHSTPMKAVMGWLRLVGSLKLQVSFAKEPYKKDYLLQKRHVILRSLLIVATLYAYKPYTHISHITHINRITDIKQTPRD